MHNGCPAARQHHVAVLPLAQVEAPAAEAEAPKKKKDKKRSAEATAEPEAKKAKGDAAEAQLPAEAADGAAEGKKKKKEKKRKGAAEPEAVEGPSGNGDANEQPAAECKKAKKAKQAAASEEPAAAKQPGPSPAPESREGSMEPGSSGKKVRRHDCDVGQAHLAKESLLQGRANRKGWAGGQAKTGKPRQGAGRAICAQAAAVTEAPVRCPAERQGHGRQGLPARRERRGARGLAWRRELGEGAQCMRAAAKAPAQCLLTGYWERAVCPAAHVTRAQWLDKRGAVDNSYEGTFGQTGWGFKAQQILGAVRGK
jgi:hypothetical protein